MLDYIVLDYTQNGLLCSSYYLNRIAQLADLVNDNHHLVIRLQCKISRGYYTGTSEQKSAVWKGFAAAQEVHQLWKSTANVTR